jgi:hypothetical protein
MRLASATLFNVNVATELIFMSPGDMTVGAYDKMAPAQLLPGRIPCGMSLWWFPSGVVQGPSVGLAGVYHNPNDTITRLATEQRVFLTGSQVQTRGTTASAPGVSGMEQPEMVGGPGMLGHGTALMRVANTVPADFRVMSVAVGQDAPAGGGVALGALQPTFSARTAAGPGPPVAAASVPYICADELFTDFDPSRGVDFQMAVDNVSAGIISQALQSGFSTLGSRFVNVAITKMVLDLQRNIGPGKRRKVQFNVPDASRHEEPATGSAGPSEQTRGIPAEPVHPV